MTMTIFLYRWKIKPGKQKQFEENWSTVTKAIREQCGSYGSRLHLAPNGEYVGYAQWPDIATREKCELDESSLDARKHMREAVEISYPDEILEVKSDLLVSLGFPTSHA
jgi:heme-degrading monooxygenase HmoA